MAGVHGGDIYFDIKVNMKPFDKAMAKIEKSSEKASNSLEKRLNKAMNVASKKMSSTLTTTMNSSAQVAGKKVESAMRKAANNASKSFKNSMKDTTKGINKNFGTSMSGVRAAGALTAGKLTKMFLAAFSVRQLAGFTKAALESGAAYEQAVGGIDALFGGSADKMKQYAMQAYRTAGMSATEYMEQATSFSAKLLKDTGGDTERVADLVNMAITDMSDNWNRFGGDLDNIKHAYEGLAKGNASMLDNLKIGYAGSQKEALQLAKDMGIVDESVQSFADISFEDSILAIHRVQEQLGITGTTARESLTTWAGAMNMLKASWENFKSTFGQGIIILLQPILQVIATISDALTMLGTRFLNWTKRIRGIKDEVIGKAANNDYKKTATNLGGVNSGVGNLGGAAKKSKKEVQALKKELMGFDQITKLSGEEKGTSSDTGTSNNVGTGSISGSLDTSGIEADASSAASKITDIFAKIKLPETLITALGNLKNSFKELFGILSDAGKWAYDNVLEPLGKWTINEVAPRVVDLLASAIKVINGVLETLGVILKPIWEHLLQPIAKALGDVFLVVLDALKGALDYTAAALKVVKAVLEPLWEPLIKPMCDFIAKHVVTLLKDVRDVIELVGKALELAAKALEKFAGWIQSLPQKWEDFKKRVKDFALNIKIPTWEEIKKTLDNLLGKIWEKIRSGAAKIGIDLPTWSELKQKIADLKEKIYNKIRDGAAKLGIKLPTYSEFKDKVAQLKEKFKNAFSGIKSSFSLKFSTAVGDLKSWINSNLIDKINSKFKKIPILRNHLIPRLAQGGYVKANTPQLAMIGDNRREGEIVAPESKLAAMAQAAAGNANSEEMITLLRMILNTLVAKDTNVYLDGEEIKNNVVNRINRHTKATGQLEIII